MKKRLAFLLFVTAIAVLALAPLEGLSRLGMVHPVYAKGPGCLVI
jgi:hypothetical protein